MSSQLDRTGVRPDWLHWVLAALTSAVREMPGLAETVPPGVLATAREVLGGREHAALDAQLAEWGGWATEVHFVRLLLGQASAAYGATPKVTWPLPSEADALEALICDMRCLRDWGVIADAYAVARLASLLQTVAPPGSPLSSLLELSLREAGDRPVVADIIALASVGRAAVAWSARPVSYEVDEW